MSKPLIACFDADGTLIDSLPAHILFCQDMNDRFGFGLNLPDSRDYLASKRIAKTPMSEFLLNAGFPKESIKELIGIYKKEFNTQERYKTKPFNGTSKVLKKIKKKVINLALLTSNYQKNVEESLGKSIKLFNDVFDADVLQKYYKNNKGIALNHILLSYDNPWPDNLIYVGDTEKDYQASQWAGSRFIGVSYGWEITKDEKRFPVANSVEELEQLVLK